MFHGLTGKPSEMRPLHKYLMRCGIEVDSPLLAGHGGMHKELIETRWTDWLESARQDLHRMLERCDDVVVCGLSMGGTIASILATEEPRVKGLILLSPTFTYDGSSHTPPYMRTLKTKIVHRILTWLVDHVPKFGHYTYFTERAPYGLKDQRLQRQITKAIEAAQRGENTEFGLFRTYFESLVQMFKLTDRMEAKAGEINVPTLMISSLEDTLISLFNATQCYKTLTIRNKHLVLLSNCDHVLTLDLQRNYVSRLVGEFMEATTGVKCGAPLNSSKSGFSLEMHNVLSPVSNEKFAELVPEQRHIMDLVSILRDKNIHEPDCHAMLMLNNNEPIGVLPTFIANAASVEGAQSNTRVLCIGISESAWGCELTGGFDVQRRAWHECQRIIEGMLEAYNIDQVAFVDFNKAIIHPSRNIFVKRGWLSKTLGIGTASAKAPVEDTENKCEAHSV